MSFSEFNFLAQILKAIEEAGFTEATPIQKLAIPIIAQGKDVRGSAQTGTGKTAAFMLPVLQRLATQPAQRGRGPRVLILVPTRELALQVSQESIKFSKYLSKMKTVCIYGGAPYPTQNRELSRPYEILVATPGRLMDHIERGRIQFERMEILILDEADRMLDMGFIEPVKAIAALTPPDRQTLLFSATLKGKVLELSNQLLKNPAEIKAEAEKARHEMIDQRLHFVDGISHKNQLLRHLLNDPEINQAIVFTATKRHAEQLVDELHGEGFPVGALHGDMNQGQRNRRMMQLRQGQIRILIATDVAARGLDVQTITHVINFDLPTQVEDYVHRIGRTGRAGSTGVALSFVAPKDRDILRRIEHYTGHRMTPHTVPGMEPRARLEKPRREQPARRDQPRREHPRQEQQRPKRKRF